MSTYLNEIKHNICETEKLKLLWGDKKASFQLSLLIENPGC